MSGSLLSYVLAGVGLVIAAISTWVVIKRSLDHRAANAMFVKLAGMGAVDRMRKLCRVTEKGGYFDAIDAAVAAGMAAGTREAATLTSAVEAAYDTVGREIGARWNSNAERGLLGVIVVGVAVGVALTDDDGPRRVVWLGVVGAMVGAYLLKKRGWMMEALIDGRVTVLPALVAALRGGAAPTAEPASPATEQATPATREPPLAPKEPLAKGALRVRVHRGDTFEREEILEREVTKIGKLPSAHLRLDDDKISRLHAVIENGAEGVVVIDLGSESGTLVNGDKVNKKTLRSGDVIDIGPFRIEVEIGPS